MRVRVRTAVLGPSKGGRTPRIGGSFVPFRGFPPFTERGTRGLKDKGSAMSLFFSSQGTNSSVPKVKGAHSSRNKDLGRCWSERFILRDGDLFIREVLTQGEKAGR